jgi:hypothetical protein
MPSRTGRSIPENLICATDLAPIQHVRSCQSTRKNQRAMGERASRSRLAFVHSEHGVSERNAPTLNLDHPLGADQGRHGISNACSAVGSAPLQQSTGRRGGNGR